MAMVKRSLVDRFWDKVNKNGPIPPNQPALGVCWVWIAAKDPFGYGVILVRPKNRSRYTERAHRISAHLHGLTILEGECVLHKCDVPSCINPDHLFIGTKKDNNLDRMKKERSNPTRGEESGRVKLTEENVLKIRQLFATGKYQKVDLAKQFNISASQIKHLTNGTSWTHVHQDLLEVTKKVKVKKEGYFGGYQRLTLSQAEEIRSRYKTEDITHTKLSLEYGVSRSAVTNIILGKSYVIK